MANAAYDNSGFGIYKGVFVGSSGTIIININNENTQINSAIIVIDGLEYAYTNFTLPTQGEPFTLTFNHNGDSFDFSVDAFGTNPRVTNIIINGHPSAEIVIIKELSNALVECFTGNYSGSSGDNGVFNITISNGLISGMARSTVSNEGFSLSGSVLSDGHINGGFSSSGGGLFSGTRSGNQISGTWNNPGAGDSGGWSGHKWHF